MWLELRDHFELIPYYMEWIPGLAYVEESLRYYEEFFGQHIIRLPHPLFWQYVNDFRFQTPERVAAIRRLDFPKYDFAMLDEVLCTRLNKPGLFTAMGMRAADGLMRRNLIIQQGVLGYKRRRFFYPIWDWTVADVGDMINLHNVSLPIDYEIWGRTVTDFTYQFIVEVRDRFPSDWQRIRDWFPLIDLEIFRYETVTPD